MFQPGLNRPQGLDPESDGTALWVAATVLAVLTVSLFFVEYRINFVVAENEANLQKIRSHQFISKTFDTGPYVKYWMTFSGANDYGGLDSICISTGT